MGRPSIYGWETFKKEEERIFDVHPTRSALATMTTLPRDWARRNGKKWVFSIIDYDKSNGTITIKRIK